MKSSFSIRPATASEAPEIAEMAGELLNEIMNAIDVQAFNFNFDDTRARLSELIGREKYFVFLARGTDDTPAGFITLCESYALYAEGAFGTIQELYVRPEHRSNELGLQLASLAKTFGSSRGWTRLEVTTPPLPEFDRPLAFYERQGFSKTGGRKMKVALWRKACICC